MMYDQQKIEQEVENLSKRYKFYCNVFPNSIYINSFNRDWICEKHGDCYKLKHINGKQYKHKNHLHKKPLNNLQEVFEYVKNHDTNIALDRDKRLRIKYDKLYQQIENT